MWRKRYYQYVEKDANEVNSIWKILHASIFLATFACSLISAYAFDDIIRSFDHRCVLYASPKFKLAEIAIKPNSTRNSSIAEAEIAPPNELQSNWARAEEIPDSKGFFLSDQRIWFVNETHYGKIEMTRSGTAFGSTARCSTVLYVPLLSLVVSSVFGVIIVLCGRGGRGYETDILSGSWSFVYPVIFVSTVMVILSMIAAIPVNDGLQSFCSRFENYTGHSRCNHLMNYFTLDGDRVFDDFWEMCTTCHFSFIFGVLLWTLQLSLTVLRLFGVIDFKFNAISIEGEIEEAKKQKIHEALIQMFPGAKTATQISMEETYEEIPNLCNDRDNITRV